MGHSNRFLTFVSALVKTIFRYVLNCWRWKFKISFKILFCTLVGDGNGGGLLGAVGDTVGGAVSGVGDLLGGLFG